MTLHIAFNKFILSKRLKGLADKSIRDYEDFIMPMVRKFGLDTEIADLTSDMVDEYLLSLYDKPRSVATLATYIRNIKIFLQWMEKKYSINLCARDIEVPKTEKKLVRIYSQEEILAIYRSVTSESEWITTRNRAIIFLMLDSGLRQNEICTLLSDDVDFIHGIVKVHGKGKKERLVYLGNNSAKLLRKYMQLCPYHGNHMFLNRRGLPMTTDSVKHLIHKISQKLPFEFSSHKLRHNFATNFCIDQYHQYGHMDVYRLMSLMGHEDFKTTQRYLHHAMDIISAMENSSHLDMLFKDIV